MGDELTRGKTEMKNKHSSDSSLMNLFDFHYCVSLAAAPTSASAINLASASVVKSYLLTMENESDFFFDLQQCGIVKKGEPTNFAIVKHS